MLSVSFRRLAGSNLLAQSAEQLSLAAVPIVAVLSLQAGPGEIGFVASVQSLPFLLLSIQVDQVDHLKQAMGYGAGDAMGVRARCARTRCAAMT